MKCSIVNGQNKPLTGQIDWQILSETQKGLNMQLVDKGTQRNCPTSRFLTREEVIKDGKQTHPSRLNFIFKHNVPLVVKDDHALILMKKYPTITPYELETDKKDDFIKLSYVELKKVARDKGYSTRETMVKRDVLIKMINEVPNAVL